MGPPPRSELVFRSCLRVDYTHCCVSFPAVEYIELYRMFVRLIMCYGINVRLKAYTIDDVCGERERGRGNSKYCCCSMQFDNDFHGVKWQYHIN